MNKLKNTVRKFIFRGVRVEFIDDLAREMVR
jgi:hypothetical protein